MLIRGKVWEPESMAAAAAAPAAKLLQSCPTLCDLRDSSPPGSPIPGILQARTLEWVAISFSNAWKWKVKVKSLSCVQSSATPWTAAFQALPSMGFSRQEYWSGVPMAAEGNLKLQDNILRRILVSTSSQCPQPPRQHSMKSFWEPRSGITAAGDNDGHRSYRDVFKDDKMRAVKQRTKRGIRLKNQA